MADDTGRVHGETPELKELTLSNLAHGAADELWRAAWAKVLENVADPNTDPKAKRQIDMKFVVAVDEARQLGAIRIDCTAKTAPVKGVTVGVYFGRHLGRFTAVESPRQEELFTRPQGGPRSVQAAGGQGA
ncbi:MAG: hypothetical protein ACRDHF_00565 [Tepidiformaceae bacterium]